MNKYTVLRKKSMLSSGGDLEFCSLVPDLHKSGGQVKKVGKTSSESNCL